MRKRTNCVRYLNSKIYSNIQELAFANGFVRVEFGYYIAKSVQPQGFYFSLGGNNIYNCVKDSYSLDSWCYLNDLKKKSQALFWKHISEHFNTVLQKKISVWILKLVENFFVIIFHRLLINNLHVRSLELWAKL